MISQSTTVLSIFSCQQLKTLKFILDHSQCAFVFWHCRMLAEQALLSTLKSTEGKTQHGGVITIPSLRWLVMSRRS